MLKRTKEIAVEAAILGLMIAGAAVMIGFLLLQPVESKP